MLVRDIMTEEPMCCKQDDSIQDAAKMMVQCDCGEIPVVDDQQKPIGVITDRDITCRVVAEGENPENYNVGQAMTTPVITVDEFTDLAQCCQIMQDKMIRRVVVVDDEGRCCGIVSQADIALGAEGFVEDVIAEVSNPTQESANLS